MMTENLPYGKHFRVKRGPFAGKVGLWDGQGPPGNWRLSFGWKNGHWFQIADLEGPLSDKELAAPTA